MIDELKSEIQKSANKEKAEVYARFFKTGKGEYGEGDVFLGLSVPQLRNICKKHTELSLEDLDKLLKEEIHEFRSAAVMILVEKYKKDKEIVDFYLKNTARMNNWDLVDGSASYILGNFLLDKEKNILYKLARSKNIWERRIAIVSTFAFIRKNIFDPTLKISELLLNDSHDLIHKACGWMLREVGKKDQRVLEFFLKKNAGKMPRTMLRYSIEKFSPEKRKHYMNLKT